MKRLTNEPSTSTGKRARPARFTLQHVMEALDDSDGDEADFHQYDYSSTSDVDLDRDLDSDRSSDDNDRFRARSTVRGRERVPQTDFCGDNVPDDGWTATFVAPTIDLNFNEDGTGPVNIPESTTEESSCVGFLFLFVEDDFWQNLSNKTNLRAQQVCAAKPNSYHAKNFQDASVDEMKAFLESEYTWSIFVSSPATGIIGIMRQLTFLVLPLGFEMS
ncbi:hypothetical protein BsWGS_12194 [Bradybaena similaris]